MKYINTLDYGQVKVRYNKLYTLELIDCIELVGGDYYCIYKNWNGELVAIKDLD